MADGQGLQLSSQRTQSVTHKGVRSPGLISAVYVLELAVVSPNIVNEQCLQTAPWFYSSVVKRPPAVLGIHADLFLLQIEGAHTLGVLSVSWAPAVPRGSLNSGRAPGPPVRRFVSGGCDNLVKVLSACVRAVDKTRAAHVTNAQLL